MRWPLCQARFKTRLIVPRAPSPPPRLMRADQQIEESKLVQAVSYVSLGSKRSVAGGFPGAAAVRGAFEPSLLARDRLYHRGHVPTAPVHVVPAGFE